MNIAVAQSGGPTCAINASLVGVFREALAHTEIDAIFGSINGIEGIIRDHMVDLKSIIRSNADMELLRQTPSTVPVDISCRIGGKMTLFIKPLQPVSREDRSMSSSTLAETTLWTRS